MDRTLDTMIGVGGTETFFQNTKVGINREPQTGYSLDVQGRRASRQYTMTGNATVTGETTTAVVNITAAPISPSALSLRERDPTRHGGLH